MQILSRLSLILIAVLLVTFLVVPTVPLVDKGYREKTKALRQSLTRAEFEAVLGPPGDYRIDRSSVVNHYRGATWGQMITWTDDYIEIWAFFDPKTGKWNDWIVSPTNQKNNRVSIIDVIMGRLG